MQQGKAARLARDDHKAVDATLRALLADVLGLAKKRIAAFDADTELFGALPEFDSLAVANLLTGIEERLSVVIEDDDVEAEDFMTYGRLLAFAQRKAAYSSSPSPSMGRWTRSGRRGSPFRRRPRTPPSACGCRLPAQARR